jgi:hypothetical protein
MHLDTRVRRFTETVRLEIWISLFMFVDDIEFIEAVDRPFSFYLFAADRVAALFIDDAFFSQLPILFFL